jgi:hypothetical protein
MSPEPPVAERGNGVTAGEVAALLGAHGCARALADPPFSRADREAALAAVIARDSARDDAVTFVVRRQGEVHGVLVLRFPAWDAKHFGWPLARVEHVQASDAEAFRVLAGQAVREADARQARMC